MTHKLWKDLLRNLQDIHGMRVASPDAIWELHKLADALEAKFLTFTLAKGEITEGILPDSHDPPPPPSYDTERRPTPTHGEASDAE